MLLVLCVGPAKLALLPIADPQPRRTCSAGFLLVMAGAGQRRSGSSDYALAFIGAATGAKMRCNACRWTGFLNTGTVRKRWSKPSTP